MNPSKTEWLARAQVGMFYHFGLYTLLGGNENQVRQTEGKEAYRALLQQFNPTRFNADEWVDCAVSMGARYIVPTAKHAEGFCLWDSQLTDLKSTNTPFGRDILAELAASAAKKGVRFCFYFNLETWLNDGNDVWNRKGMSYADFFEAQLAELLTGYGPVGLIWFDHSTPEIPRERFKKIIATIKRLQPGCLVNNRGVHGGREYLGDFLTPERLIPPGTAANRELVECCDAMGVHSWGFHKQEAFWSTSELARRVSLCRSHGYNYLLNVEPTPEGTIRPECAERARGLGGWIAKNRAALDAGPCPAAPLDAHQQHRPALGVSTLAGKTLHLHLHQWPAADELIVKVSGRAVSASLDGKRLTARTDGEGLRIGGLPADMPAGNAPWMVAVEFAEAPEPLPAAPQRIVAAVEGESIQLLPPDARLDAANGVVLPTINRFANGNLSIGSLFHEGDTAAWRVEAPAEGDYEVWMNLGSIATQADAGFELSSGAATLSGRTWLTEHYSLPVRKSVGRLRLAKGENRVVLRVTDAPRAAFSDVHGITLIPVR